YGLTSSDVVDTATAVALRDAGDLLVEGTGVLTEAVRRRALQHRRALMAGRTHGMHAEPTTFGLKLAGWAFELARDRDRLRRVRGIRALLRGPEGVVRDASQTQPGCLRTYMWAGQAAPGLREHRLREHSALAREGYLPLVGGEDLPSGRMHSAGLHARGHEVG